MRLTMMVLAAATTAFAQGPRPDTMTLWEYEDASGLHQVERLQDVPKKYRSKAREVTAAVVVGPSGGAKKGPPGRETLTRPDAGTAPPVGPVPPAGPVPTRYYCRWQASVRPTPKACRNDGDCGGDVCVKGSCVKGGTHEDYTAREVGGKQWHGCYADTADLREVKRACERDGRSKSGEDVTCECFTNASAVDAECR